MSSVNNTDFQLAPGEANPYGDRFYENIAVPWVKAQMMCSTSRFVFKDPNLLLGLIPVGTVENTMPIRNIAQVATSTKFHLSRLIAGLILLVLSFILFSEGGGAAAIGVIVLLFAVATFANVLDAVLVVSNSSGGTQELRVSIFDKAKLERFKQEFQNRLFADHAQVHHDEAQQQRMQQTMLQQMALQQQIQANQNALNMQNQNPVIENTGPTPELPPQTSTTPLPENPQ